MQIFALVAAVLHIGNVTFEADKSGSRVTNPAIVQQVARILSIDEKKLERRLCFENITVVGKTVEKALEPDNAVKNRDAIAKGVYDALFSYIVGRINAVCSKATTLPNTLWIGTLDVFGFEIFENNSFEQFCINFCNERLQQYFNYHVLKTEQELYLKEGLLWDPVELPDNQDAIDLIQGVSGKIGIMGVLDSSCVQPKADDVTFTSNLFKQCFSRKLKAVKTRSGRSTGGRQEPINGFSVQHYAGTVTYNAASFLTKNADQAHPDTVALFCSSRDEVCANIYSSLNARNAERKQTTVKATSVQFIGSMFAENLNSLVRTLDLTNPFFIRCIKPNTVKKPKQFDPEYVRPQLRCGGLIQALKIIKCGFPVRVAYSKIWELFGSILNGCSTPTNINFRDFTEAIMMKLGDREIGLDEYQLGLNMVFFRPGKQSFLQNILNTSPSDVPRAKIEAIREFMTQKRIVRFNGAMRTLVRTRHGFNRRRMLQMAQAVRISQRTLGRALLKVQKMLNENKEKEDREAKLKSAEYLAGVQAAKDLKRIQEANEAEKARFAKQLEEEAKKQAQLLDDFNKSKKSTSAILKEKADLEKSVNEQKKAALDARAEANRLRADVEEAKKAGDGYKASADQLRRDLQTSQDQVSAMKQGAVVQLEEAKKQLVRLNAEFEDERNSFAGKSRDYEDRLSRLSNEQLIASKSTADLQRQLEELEKKASLQQQEANTAARRAAEDLQAEQRSNEVKFNALKKEKLVIESQLSSEAATASRALADLESAKLAAESKVREREGQIEEVRAQLRGVNERLEAAKAQGQGDLRGLQEQLNALRSSSREENDSLQKQLREAKAKTSSLQADFDQLKSSSTRNGTQLQQANIELQAELKEERASKEALRTAKEEESSRLSSQLTLLQSKMDAALAQARRDLTGTSDELKRTSAQNASKIDELLRRVRELESELNSKSTELNITTEQRNNARESLAKLTAVLSLIHI